MEEEEEEEGAEGKRKNRDRNGVTAEAFLTRIFRFFSNRTTRLMSPSCQRSNIPISRFTHLLASGTALELPGVVFFLALLLPSLVRVLPPPHRFLHARPPPLFRLGFFVSATDASGGSVAASRSLTPSVGKDDRRLEVARGGGGGEGSSIATAVSTPRDW